MINEMALVANCRLKEKFEIPPADTRKSSTFCVDCVKQHTPKNKLEEMFKLKENKEVLMAVSRDISHETLEPVLICGKGSCPSNTSLKPRDIKEKKENQSMPRDFLVPQLTIDRSID